MNNDIFYTFTIAIDHIVLLINLRKQQKKLMQRRIRDFTADELDLAKHSDKLQYIMKFWKAHWQDIPTIAKLERYCITITPSSAGAERVFSIMKRMFSKNQMTAALQDYTEASVMLAYNGQPARPSRRFISSGINILEKCR